MDKKQTQSLKEDSHKEQCALPQDHPLDPAVERVRKKLMRLMIASISITLILLFAVLVGIVYKIMTTPSTSKQTHSFSSHEKNAQTAHYTLSFPKNTQILSQSLSGNYLIFKILTPERKIKFMFYNYLTNTLTTVLTLEEKEETSSL
nr:hypothetical protein [Bartonella raoultii]